MEKFSTVVTTMKAYEVSERMVEELGNDIEGIINDYIINNWDVDYAADVPLEVRMELLQHIVSEMVNGDFTWLGEEE